MNTITLHDIAGYATEKTTWRLILQLVELAQNCDLCRLNPKNVIVDGDSFSIDTTAVSKGGQPFAAPEYQLDSCSPTANVWTIGALAFYALMGVVLFEEKGGRAQTETTYIPRIPQSHCSRQLSEYIYRCLSFHTGQRPTIDILRQESERALSSEDKPPRCTVNPSGKVYRTSLVKFWPEAMYTIVLLLFLIGSSTAFGQNKGTVPQELAAIVGRCVQLRTPSNAEKVARAFAYDHEWTLMDELPIDRNGECTVNNKVATFGINDMCYRLVIAHDGVANASGRFRNGQDRRFKYSFIEVTAKKGFTIGYDITCREGSQIFVIVPFVPTAAFDVSMKHCGKAVGTMERADNGCVYVYIDEHVKPGDMLHLSIKNRSHTNMAFVVINYNSRQ